MRLIATILSVGLLLAPPPAAAIEGRGAAQVLAVVDAASTSGKVGQRDLEPGAPVFFGDKVMTGPAGEAQLLFRDGTRVVLGPSASLALDWPDPASGGGPALRALVGSFRVVVAPRAPLTLAIDTPHAKITTRGASFDFTVYGGRTSLVLLKGAATLCSEVGGCTTIDRSCELVYGNAAKGITIVGKDGLQPQLAAGTFPYLVSQASLLVEFRFDPRSCRSEWVQERPEPAPPGETAAAPDTPAGPAADPVADPVAEPDQPPATDPVADGGRGDNGIGNGGETTQNEDPDAAGDPSNPGVGGSGPGGGGKGRGKV